METVVFVTHILMWILCPTIIGLVLLQGAAGDISSAFGGGGMLDSTLGVGAHRKMAQVTGALAFLFFVMVLILAYPHRDSFRNKVPAAPAQTAPATSTPAPPQGAPAAAQAPAPAQVEPAAASPAPADQPRAAAAPAVVPAPAPVVVPPAPPVAAPAAVPEVQMAPAAPAAAPASAPGAAPAAPADAPIVVPAAPAPAGEAPQAK